MAGEIKKYVRYYLQKRSKWAGDMDMPRPIVLAFNYDGKRLCTLVGFKVAEKDWDANKQRVKLNVKRGNQLNRILERLEDKVNDIYFNARSEGKRVDNEYILQGLREETNKVTRPLFFEEWRKYLDIQKHKLKKGTLRGKWASYNKFFRFRKGKRIEFEDITPELLSKYADYLLEIGNVNNTIHSSIKKLRTFMSYAKKIKLHNSDGYLQFNLPEKVGRIKFLDWAEMKLLLDYKPVSQFEQKVLDNFLFSCFTGMRHSDYQNLKIADIKQHHFDGDDAIYVAANVRQVKTDNITVIPLLPMAVDILNRYKDSPLDFALPRLSNTVINRTIKLIGEKAGLHNKVAVDVFRGAKRETKYYQQWELLTTHYGRRSFVSLAASRGLPMHIIASITGQNVKTTLKHYSGVIDRDRFTKLIGGMKF